LEHTPRNPGPPRDTQRSDPELYGLPLGIPAGVLGDDGWETMRSRAILLGGAVELKNTHLGEDG
jgi:hypothetical protein